MNRLHLILPVVAGFAASDAAALEAVAQSPVGGGSAFGAANLATDAKITAVKAEAVVLKQTVSELKAELKNVTDCAALGKIWDGTSCILISGSPTTTSSSTLALPVCTTSQTLVSYDGKTLTCQDTAVRGITECPAGFTLVGRAGEPAAYCITSQEQPTSNYRPALEACGAMDTAIGRAHVCSRVEWFTACQYAAGMQSKTDNWELTSDHGTGDWGLEGWGGMISVGSGSCSAVNTKEYVGGVGNTRSRPYRCCVK